MPPHDTTPAIGGRVYLKGTCSASLHCMVIPLYILCIERP